jgi:hypothetical protein
MWWGLFRIVSSCYYLKPAVKGLALFGRQILVASFLFSLAFPLSKLEALSLVTSGKNFIQPRVTFKGLIAKSKITNRRP